MTATAGRHARGGGHSDETPWSVGSNGTLYASGTNGNLYTVHLDRGRDPGRGHRLGSAGDLAFNGGTFISARHPELIRVT